MIFLTEKILFPELDEILKKTSQAMEEGKAKIFDIAENSRSESERIIFKLKKVQEEISEVIEEFDKTERLEKRARIELMEVSKKLHALSNQEIKRAYEKASDLQTQVKLLKEKENYLRAERTELEYQYRRFQDTIIKADELATKLNLAMDFLQDNLSSINEKFAENKLRGELGIRIISAQEEERKRIAREIHDGPAQLMANLVLRAELCEKLVESDVPTAKKELLSLKEQTRESLKDVRKIIYELRPMILDDLGLKPALTRYLDEYSKDTGIRTSLEIKETPIKWSNKVFETALYRVVQEALTNSRKHSECKEIKIDLNLGNEEIALKISDDGCGFNQQEVANERGKRYGILGMKERIEVLNGEFKLESSNEGTVISVLLRNNAKSVRIK